MQALITVHALSISFNQGYPPDLMGFMTSVTQNFFQVPESIFAMPKAFDVLRSTLPFCLLQFLIFCRERFLAAFSGIL